MPLVACASWRSLNLAADRFGRRPRSLVPTLRAPALDQRRSHPSVARARRVTLPYGGGWCREGNDMATTPYDTDLDRNPANFQPLTPLTLLERAAAVYPAQTAIVHGPLRRSYAEFYARARRLG